LLRPLSKVLPFRAFRLRPGVYGRTLHVSGTGEWEFDTTLKPLDGFPVTFGWMNAIRHGHRSVHRGIETGAPTLVLRSSRSHSSAEYTPPVSDRSDLVIDTRQTGRWAGHLGRDVTEVVIADARHDVFLSLPEVRARAYAELGRWLDRLGAGAEPAHQGEPTPGA
jgi:alpha-beta hydrolase superfamily lysophospholipase